MNSLMNKLIARQDLEEEEIRSIVEDIKNNAFDESQLGSILCLLQAKGVKAEELHILVRSLMELAKTVNIDEDCIDVCGTGGDGSKTFNISTATAIVAAAAGAKVAKHGNKAISSNSGSFDVLQRLNISLDSDQLQSLKDNDVGFFFAPKHHPVFANIATLRKKLGIRTVFNLIGPLLNPAGVKRQLIGVYDPKLVQLVAGAMLLNGIEHGMVVHGNGLDEITIDGKTNVAEIKDKRIITYEIDPKDYGMQDSLENIRAESSEESAKMITEMMDGNKGPARDIVLLNCAAALKVAGKARDLKEGIEKAKETIDSGKAKQLMERLG